MAGVPRSRGCTKCRQQKKKCIVSLSPPCSRCKRLKISCIGYGERRLKFQDESQNFAPLQHRTKATVSTASSKSPPPIHNVQNYQQVGWEIITNSPTNTLSSLIASFAFSIDGRNADTGQHLIWNFGAFLQDVPRHLGSNKSLDAAADALVAGYDHFRRNGCIHTPASMLSLGKYSQAVKRLRESLSTIEKACEPTTLCAIQIVMVVEGLLGISNTSPLQHAGGAARLLKCRGTRPPKDELERKLLMSLRGPVVIKAFFLDADFYTEVEWASLVSGFSVGTEEDGFFSGLAATARLYQYTRKLKSQNTASVQETERLVSCAYALHKNMTERLSDLSKRLDFLREAWQMDMYIAKSKFDHGFCTRDYGLAITTQIQINCILTVLCREWYESAKRENTMLCEAICRLGESDAIFHRPLGSAWILIALSVAYIGANSAQSKNRVVKLFADYSHDFSGEVAHAQPIEMQLNQLAQYLSCKDLLPEF